MTAPQPSWYIPGSSIDEHYERASLVPKSKPVADGTQLCGKLLLQTQQLQWLLARCNIHNELLVLKLTIDSRKLETATNTTHSWLEGLRQTLCPMTSLALVEELEPGGRIRTALEDCNAKTEQVADAIALSQTLDAHELSDCAAELSESLRETLRTSVRRAAEFVHAEVDDPALRNELIEASTALLLDLNEPVNPNAALLPYVPALKSMQTAPAEKDHTTEESDQLLDYAIAHVRGLMLDPTTEAPPGMSTQSSGRTITSNDTADTEDLAAGPSSSSYLLPKQQYNVFFGSSSAIIDRAELEFCQDSSDGKPVELGRGVTGVVYRAIRGQVQRVAVKVLSARASVRQRNDFLQEMHTLQQCRDRHIVQFYGAVVPDEQENNAVVSEQDVGTHIPTNQFMLVMELMEGGTLYDAIANDDMHNRMFGWWRRGKSIALDIARGLAYLHSRNITHMDMKSANVLLTRDMRPKIGDVGFARAVRASSVGTSASTALGTFAWSAPELLLGEACDEAVDIFSFGVVLWEICTGLQPVRGAMMAPDPSSAPAEVLQLIKACRAPLPSARPKAKEVVGVLEHAIFASKLEKLSRVQSVPLPGQQENVLGLLPPAEPGPHAKLKPLFDKPPKEGDEGCA